VIFDVRRGMYGGRISCIYHDYMVGLVEQMLQLHKRLPAARTPQEKELLARQVAATDAAIDKLVYALYRLTEAEIGIVEGKQ